MSTKYKIHTKYNDNSRPNKPNESWKTTFAGVDGMLLHINGRFTA
jgi:hypothetical protein